MELEKVLSSARLHPYLLWTDNNIGDAISLYKLNLKTSASLLAILHILEITLRNAINECLTKAWDDKWYMRTEIVSNESQKKRLSEVVFWLSQQSNNKEITNFQIVSNLNFGFWTTLFCRDYNLLWGKHLRKIFESGKPIQRKDISDALNELRKLRNRVAHYERVIHLNLANLYRGCRRLIG